MKIRDRYPVLFLDEAKVREIAETKLSLLDLASHDSRWIKWLKMLEDFERNPSLKPFDPPLGNPTIDLLAKYYLRKRVKYGYAYDGLIKITAISFFVRNGRCEGYRVCAEFAWSKNKIYASFNCNHQLDMQVGHSIVWYQANPRARAGNNLNPILSADCLSSHVSGNELSLQRHIEDVPSEQNVERISRIKMILSSPMCEIGEHLVSPLAYERDVAIYRCIRNMWPFQPDADAVAPTESVPQNQ